jgi:hypothetical protein
VYALERLYPLVAEEPPSRGEKLEFALAEWE